MYLIWKYFIPSENAPTFLVLQNGNGRAISVLENNRVGEIWGFYNANVGEISVLENVLSVF